MKKEKIQIIWFKKNLRIHDNEILANIKPDVPTLGVYFFENSILEAPDSSERHLKFVCESLSILKKNLKKYNIPLITLPYEAIEGFSFLQKHYDIRKIFSHEETGNFLTFQRDMKVIDFCKDKHIRLKESPTNGVVRRLKSRDVWSRIWNTRMHEEIFIAQKCTLSLEIGELETLSQQTFRSFAQKIQALK